MNPAPLLYTPLDGEAPVGVLTLDMPKHDNLQLVWTEVTVHPDLRRRGHGTEIMNEALRRTKDAGRAIIWAGVAKMISVARLSSRSSASVTPATTRGGGNDWPKWIMPRSTACTPRLSKRHRLSDRTAHSPVPDEVLAELVEVTAAINDAPAGTLTYEDEVFDTARLHDIETARQKRGDILYRVVARHRSTGKVGGHTQVVFNPLEPTIGHIGDTAVDRAHRGHRLGLLLKIDMMRWLAYQQPQLEIIETWNNVDNRYMINVNEAIGYRLSRVSTPTN